MADGRSAGFGQERGLERAEGPGALALGSPSCEGSQSAPAAEVLARGAQVRCLDTARWNQGDSRGCWVLLLFEGSYKLVGLEYL